MSMDGDFITKSDTYQIVVKIHMLKAEDCAVFYRKRMKSHQRFTGHRSLHGPPLLYFAGPQLLKQKEIRTYENKILRHGTRSEGLQKRHLHKENKEMKKVNEIGYPNIPLIPSFNSCSMSIIIVSLLNRDIVSGIPFRHSQIS